ncbi:MAG: LPXTG cell wall anchor domain-containing protein [Acidimicrobiia bacterium]|nr:LPXTG cell wall anchor domain-containing protein [Acidimicrobiia bacterium]
MIRRLLLALAFLVAAVGVAAASPTGAATQQSYAGCVATISSETPTAGEVVTVEGTGATASGTVTASLDGKSIGYGTATDAGAFSFSATIPATANGDQTVDVDCGDAVVVVLDITVGAATPGSPTLPATGSDSLPLAGMGLAALAIGIVVLIGARLRSKSASI